MFKRLIYLLTAPAAVDSMIEAERDRLAEEERENNAHRLHLCFKHRQEQNHYHCTSLNCAYCQAERKVKELDVANGLLKSRNVYLRKKVEAASKNEYNCNAADEELKEANASIKLRDSRIKALESSIDQYRRGELDPG